MPTIRLHIAYDGTDFHGWQIQPQQGIRTVQGELIAALAKLHNDIQDNVKLQGASRTDAGVHAFGQVASFDAHADRDIWDYVRGLNALTGPDVTVNHAEHVEDFNARHDSAGKIYRYRVWNHRFDDPIQRRGHWNIREPLDMDAMKRAATQMLGERDYSAFRAADCQGATAIRRVDRVDVRNYGNAGIEFEVEGSAFLKNMVRIMAGTLVDVGRGNIPAESIQDVVDSKDRGRAGTTAPARGLTLVEIFYPQHPWQRPVGIGMPGRY